MWHYSSTVSMLTQLYIHAMSIYIYIKKMITIKWSLITISSMYLVSSSTLRGACGAWGETRSLSVFFKNQARLIPFKDKANIEINLSHACVTYKKKQEKGQINKDKLCRAKPGLSISQIPNKDESSTRGLETDSCSHLTVCLSEPASTLKINIS